MKRDGAIIMVRCCGFCPAGNFPRRHSSSSRLIKESTYSCNIHSVRQKKISGAAWNRWVMMTFLRSILLFAPGSKRCLGWRKKENPEGTALVDFVTFGTVTLWYSFVLGVISDILWSSCFLKVMDQKTLVKRGAYKCVHINTWRVCQRSHGVMVSTLDSESSDPSISLGGTLN